MYVWGTLTIGYGFGFATVGAEHSSTGRTWPHLPLPYRKIISVFYQRFSFYSTKTWPEPMVRVFAPLRSAQNTRPPDEPGPIFRFLTIYAFFYLQDTIQFHLLRSPWRSTERLRTSKLPLCYHFSKTQQEIFPHHTAAYIKSLRFPVYRLFYSFYNIEVTRSWSGNRPPTK